MYRSFKGLALLTLCSVLLVTLFSSVADPSQAVAGSAYVRLNQVGYILSEPKQALLMASGSETGATFSVVRADGSTAYSGSVGANQGSWSSSFPNVYTLDFSSLSSAGTYYIQVSGSSNATSPTFKVDSAANLYTPLMRDSLFFFQAQHDGSNVNSAVMNRKPAHLTDQSASISNPPNYSNDVLQGNLSKVGGPIDVSGGWFDAGD
jgi:endoglucanase